MDPLSLPLLITYEKPTTILGSAAGIMRDYTNEHICTSPRVRNISTMETYIQVSPSYPIANSIP